MKTRYEKITEARLRAAAIRTAASENTDRKKRNSTTRRPRLRVVEIARRVADRCGYERLDEKMEAVD